MIALSAVAVFVARKRLPLVHWLLIGFSIFSGAYAARNLPFASMLLMIVVGPLLSLQKFGPGLLFRLKQWRERELSVRLSLWPGLSIIFGVLVCARGGRILGKQVMNAHFDAARLPVQAAAALQERGIHDPIFSLDSWGGYFIYRLYPETRVFVDDRHDFYGDAYIREYLNVLHVQDGWQQVLQAWKVKLVVMPPESHLARALRDSPQWEIVYRDATAMILRRRA
jgi:hypothetical protein